MTCTNCGTTIELKYCPKCGQYLKPGKVTSFALVKDALGNMFSLDSALAKNLKMAFLDPGKLFNNYLEGYRGYFYSPGKFFVTAGVFALINSMVDDKFLGIAVFSPIAPQFTILLVNIFLIASVAWVVYFREKRNSTEHLILTIYSVSLWTMVFVPISMIIYRMGDLSQPYPFIPMHILIIIWISRAFDFTTKQRVLHILAHIGILYLVIGLVAWNIMSS